MYLLAVYIGIALGAAIYLVGRLSGRIHGEGIGGEHFVPSKGSLLDPVASCLLSILAIIYLGKYCAEAMSVNQVSLLVFVPQVAILFLTHVASQICLILILSVAHHVKLRSR